MSHITSIKDVVELKITRDKKSLTWICPLTEKDVVKESTSQRFVYIVECGHCMTEKALREISTKATTGNFCPICDTEYSDSNLITLNSTSQELLIQYEDRIQRLTDEGLTHSLKEKKKQKKSNPKTTDRKRKPQSTSIIASASKKLKPTAVTTD